MHPILLEDPVTIYAFGVFVVLGLIVGAAVTYWNAKRLGMRTSLLPDIFLTTMLAGLVGARLWYLLFSHARPASAWQFITFSGGGLAFQGGLIAGLLALFYLLRRQREPLNRWLDVLAPGLLVGLAIGKIGSLLSGDSIGVGSGLPWAVTLPGIGKVHPLPAYFTLGCAVLGYALWHYRRHPIWRRPGMLFAVTIGGLSLLQLILEPLHSSRDALYLGNIRITAIVAIVFLLIIGGWQRGRRRTV